MNWYHAVSKDMIHWAHLPVALTPDHDYDCGGEFSGSATVLHDNNLTPVLSVSVACGKWVFMAIPAQSRSSDPLMIHWTKSGNMPGSNAPFDGPVYNAPAYSTGGFRDPTSAWKSGDTWRMATGCGDKKKGGTCLFKSTNFVNWTATGWLHHPQTPNNPQFWECPDFYPVPGTDLWVLKASANGDWWSVGTYTPVKGLNSVDTFVPQSEDIHGGDPATWGLQKYDLGQFYASKTFYDPSKRRQVLWGWVAEEGPVPHPGEDWSSLQSLPRVVSLDPMNKTRLVFTPIPELESLRGAKTSSGPLKVAPGASVQLSGSCTGRRLDLVITMTGNFSDSHTVAGVSVMADPKTGKDGTLAVVGGSPNNDNAKNFATLNNGGHAGAFFNPGQLAASGKMSLRVLVDRSIVEAYAQGGRGVATKRAYPPITNTGTYLVNTGANSVTAEVDCYQMAVADPPTVGELLKSVKV
eukprot:UC1_evm1s1574